MTNASMFMLPYSIQHTSVFIHSLHLISWNRNFTGHQIVQI